MAHPKSGVDHFSAETIQDVSSLCDRHGKVGHDDLIHAGVAINAPGDIDAALKAIKG